MITFRNIEKQFSDGHSAVLALKKTNLTILEKQFVVVVGSNGSGKSTFLNLIAGNYPPTQGELFFDGKSVNHLKDYERSPWVARMFQNPLSGTAADLSILDNFRLAALRTKNKTLVLGKTKSFVEEVKQKISILNLGLENNLDQQMGLLSGGQRQALTLLMATMDHTRLLLMDEPTASLDPRSATLVMKMTDQIICQLNITAILVTHHLKDAFSYGNRLLLFNEGEIISDLDSKQKESLPFSEMQNWFN